VRLIPLDLQADAAAADLGRPRLADTVLGRRIIDELARRSRRLGTTIRYDAATNEGAVVV
jgi:hypothetical protein